MFMCVCLCWVSLNFKPSALREFVTCLFYCIIWLDGMRWFHALSHFQTLVFIVNSAKNEMYPLTFDVWIKIRLGKKTKKMKHEAQVSYTIPQPGESGGWGVLVWLNILVPGIQNSNSVTLEWSPEKRHWRHWGRGITVRRGRHHFQQHRTTAGRSRSVDQVWPDPRPGPHLQHVCNRFTTSQHQEYLVYVELGSDIWPHETRLRSDGFLFFTEYIFWWH